MIALSRGHDPGLLRTLCEAADSLSGLPVLHSPSLVALLPEVVKMGSEDPSMSQPPVRVLGGSLTSNNKGVPACTAPVFLAHVYALLL